MAKSKKKDPELIAVSDAARLLGVSEDTARRYGDEKLIPCVRDSKDRRVFKFQDVVHFIKEQQAVVHFIKELRNEPTRGIAKIMADAYRKRAKKKAILELARCANAKRHVKLIQQEARTQQEVIRRQLEAEQSQRWTEQHELKALEKQLRRKERRMRRMRHPTLAQIRRRTAKVSARCEALDLLAFKEAELQKNLDATRLSVEETRKLRQAKHEAMERANAMRKEEPSDGNAKPH